MRRLSVLSPRMAFLLVCGGVALRFMTLGRQSLWLDEAFGVWAATAHTAEVIWTTRLDPNEPSLYYLVLHWFLGLTGVSEATARMPSAISSAAGLALVYGLGRMLWPGTAVGRTAAVLVAVAPIDIWFAQEARMHGFVASAGLVLALGLFIERWWAAPLIAAGLAWGLCLDHTMWPLAIVLASVWAVHWWHRGHDLRAPVRVLAGAAAAWALYHPVWPEAADVYARLNTVPFFNNARRFLGLENLSVLPFPLALLAFGSVCLAGTGIYLRLSRQLAWRRRLDDLLLALFLGGTVFAAVPRGYGLKQILVAGWPLLALLAASALASVGDRVDHRVDATSVDRLALPCAIAVSLCALGLTLGHSRADWRSVAAHLSNRSSSTVAVVLDPAWNQKPYNYYRPDHPAVVGPVTSMERLLHAGAGVTEACLIAERFGPPPPTSLTEAWLDQNLGLISSTTFPRLELRCYRVR